MVDYLRFAQACKDAKEAMTTKPQSEETNHEFWYTSVFPNSRQPLLKVGDKLEVVETKDDVLDLHYGNCFSAKLARLSPASTAPVVDEYPTDLPREDASRWVTNKLRPEHKCRPLARAVMMEGRDWWIGELTEPVPEWPHETHCLHMKTPMKDVSFLCNAGDFEQLFVLSNVIVKLENLTWLRAATARSKAFTLPPFRSCTVCGHNNVDERGVCQERVQFLHACLCRCVPSTVAATATAAPQHEVQMSQAGIQRLLTSLQKPCECTDHDPEACLNGEVDEGTRYCHCDCHTAAPVEQSDDELPE